VGPAPNIGRDRWLALCKALDEGVTPVDELAELARGLTGQDSDARFETVLKAAKSAPAPRPRRTPTTPLTGAGGAQIGEVRKTAKSLTLKVSERDFAEWLVAHMDRIHRDYKQDRGE
jgi:ParB family chromosome partitioning protein